MSFLVSVFGLAATVQAQGTGAAASASTAIKLLIVDGYGNHDWQRTTQLLRNILETSNLFTVTVATAPASTNDSAYNSWCPLFSNFDVVVQTCNDFNGRGPLWPAAARKSFEDYVAGGGGVFIFHSANNAFADWPAYNEIIGLGWRNSDYGWALRVRDDNTIERIAPGKGAATSHGPRTDVLVHRLGEHPIHAGMPHSWLTPQLEVYTYARGPARNLTVLSWAEDPATREHWPIEWIVQYGQGCAYVSTFGHVWKDEADPVNMRCAGFQTLLIRALQWLANKPVTYAIPADFPGKNRPALRNLPLGSGQQSQPSKESR